MISAGFLRTSMWKLVFMAVGVQLALSEREHKVHNIVLYPDKHSWCRTTPIQQVIASPGFDSVTIDNNICVGTCFSYSIPKTNPAEPGELIGPYCDSCQPSQIKCYHVNLRSGTQVVQKRVQIIQNCTCMSCEKTDKYDCEVIDKQSTDELPSNMLSMEENDIKSSSEDVPDLFDVPKPSKDMEELVESVKNLEEFAPNTTSDSDEENLMKKYKILLEKHREWLSSKKIEANNAKIEDDLEDLPARFGIEGSSSGHKGAHIGMGIETEEQVDVETPKAPHYHHLGEVQHVGGSLERLVKGPHDSLALTPIEEKLHIDSDNLKPINEGLVVTYENMHHQHHHKKKHSSIEDSN